MSQPVEMSLAQASTVAGLAERVQRGFPSDADRLIGIAVWPDGDLLHVLVNPPGEWLSVDRTGDVVSRHLATRPEAMTVLLRASPQWSSMRRLIQEKGVDPWTTVLVDAFDEDESEDVGVLITDEPAVVEWRRRYSDEQPERDVLVAWNDITSTWRGGPWKDEIAQGLLLRSEKLRRLRG